MPARPHLPLNALRAFEAAARRLSFTGAATELFVTQAAVSHQVKHLEERLGVTLFRRLPRGLVLTDEGQALLPVLTDSFDRMGHVLERFRGGAVREVLSVGVVGTFAVRWLMPRLPAFHEAHPLVDLRLQTHNNKVDLAGEGLDLAIRFGDGAWHGVEAREILRAPLFPLCTPAIAAKLSGPEDVASFTMLRSYRQDEWPAWFAAAGLPAPPLSGTVFDSVTLMVQAALLGAGIAIAPAALFERELENGQLMQPFEIGVDTGGYWLTWLKARQVSGAMKAFIDWIAAA